MYPQICIFLSLISCFVFGDSTTDYHENQQLRYGFQKTEACKSFDKVFLCVRKCLDQNYDIAVADNDCNCKCYAKKDKAKYKSTYYLNQTNNQNWKLGVLITKLPLWAQAITKEEEKPNNYEANGSDGKNEQEPTIFIHTTEADLGNLSNASNTMKTDSSAQSRPTAGNSTTEVSNASEIENKEVTSNATEANTVTETESATVTGNAIVAGTDTDTGNTTMMNNPIETNLMEANNTKDISDSTVRESAAEAGNGTNVSNATVLGNGTDTSNATMTRGRTDASNSTVKGDLTVIDNLTVTNTTTTDTAQVQGGNK